MRLHCYLTVVLVALSACSENEYADTGGLDGDSVGALAPAATPADTTVPLDLPDTSAPTATHVAVMQTTVGEIRVALFGETAPKAVENFIGLAGKGKYDSTRFHRVIPGFILQGGDPLSKDTSRWEQWGEGGSSIWGRPFVDEIDSTSRLYREGYRAGTVAMANTGPNQNRSQFFIVLSDEQGRSLSPSYTIFGQVVGGFETLGRIERTAFVVRPGSPGSIGDTLVQETPRNAVAIKNITVTELPTIE